jgi:hypothetical protein
MASFLYCHMLTTTRCLQNPYGQRIGERLKLQTLTILERDDTWRRIQYVGSAGGVEIRITHRSESRPPNPFSPQSC